MKYLNKLIVFYIVVALLVLYQESYGQFDKKDSIAISIMGAVKITDSINTPLPDSIRLVTLLHFKKLGLEPSNYYTTRDLGVQKRNNLGESKAYEIQSRNSFKSLDNLDVSKNSLLIASFKNNTKIENSWIVEFYKIGALRDRCFYNKMDEKGYYRIGAWGGEGDDIMVVYNSNFSKILKIYEAE
jgi:hypothetical protein